jgi:hypothetical protein
MRGIRVRAEVRVGVGSGGVSMGLVGGGMVVDWWLIDG